MASNYFRLLLPSKQNVAIRITAFFLFEIGRQWLNQENHGIIGMTVLNKRYDLKQIMALQRGLD
jgi:hypothetical protein